MWKLLSRVVSGFGTQGRNMGGDRRPTAIDMFAFYLQVFGYTQKTLFDLRFTPGSGKILCRLICKIME